MSDLRTALSELEERISSLWDQFENGALSAADVRVHLRAAKAEAKRNPHLRAALAKAQRTQNAVFRAYMPVEPTEPKIAVATIRQRRRLREH
jgi:hypothetical protein